jgi:AAHS family 4-hydroxybenzoate transporter-like MFS transporter
MVAVMLIGFIVGSVTVGLISAALVPAFGWQAVFIVGGALALLLLPLLLVVLPESIRFLVLKQNSRSAVARLVRRIDPSVVIDGNTRLVVDERPASAVSVFSLFRDGRARITVLLWIIYFMSLLNLYLVASWLTTHITALGIPVGTAILIGTMFQVGGAFGSIFGWMVDKRGASRAITTAYLIGAAAIACIGLAEANRLLLGLATFAAGFGIIGGQTATNGLSAIAYPTQIRATGVGWATGIGRIGSIVGPGLAGIFVGLGISTQHVFYMAVIPALCASLAGVALGASHRPLAAKEHAAE